MIVVCRRQFIIARMHATNAFFLQWLLVLFTYYVLATVGTTLLLLARVRGYFP